MHLDYCFGTSKQIRFCWMNYHEVDIWQTLGCSISRSNIIWFTCLFQGQSPEERQAVFKHFTDNTGRVSVNNNNTTEPANARDIGGVFLVGMLVF